MREQVYQVALTLLPKIGPVTARNLVGYCGSPKEVFSASRRDLRRIPRIGPVLSDRICSQALLDQAAEEVERLERSGISILFYLDEDYPARLKRFDDSPICLYYKGSASLAPARTIGIVGTRTPSAYGMLHCEKLVEGLSAYGVTVISGLAYGIDGVAHRTSVQAGLPTIGVMANGHGTLYPKAHQPLARRMLQNGGLLTEHVFHAQPEKDFFPMRNRIIAGLSDAVVVIESGKTGGSLITAEFANRYDREVFVLPGRVTDQRSAGCHLLLKSHKAVLFETAEDIVQWMDWSGPSSADGAQTELFAQLNGHAKIIVDLLAHSGQMSVDDLTSGSGAPVAQTVSILLELECQGFVKALPGNRYTLTR